MCNKNYQLYDLHKRYFFFDIDGTLTDNKTKKIVPSALEALHKLMEAGHFVAIATGRAHYKAKAFVDSINVNNMVCAGGACLVVDNKVVENKPLDRQAILTLIDEVEKLGYGVLLMLDDSIDVYAKNDLFVRQCGLRQEATNYIYDNNLDYHKLNDIYKVYISIPKSEQYLLKSLHKLGYLRFVEEYLMIQYDQKNVGIKEMLKLVGGKEEDVVVFGDDDNDIVMFNEKWCSVAMGNGKDSVKQIATYVTDANVDDGIYKACEKFGWFKAIK